MRRLHGIEDGHEHGDARAQIQRVLVRIGRDRRSVDIIHDQIRRAVAIAADVQQRGDIRMCQRAENALLQRETAAQVARVEQQEFDRDEFVERAIGAARAIHAAHAARSDESVENPGADLFAAAIHRIVEWFTQEIGCAPVGFEKFVHFAAQGDVVAARLIQPLRSRRYIPRDRFVEHVERAARIAHAGPPPAVSSRRRYNHACAPR